MIAFYNDNQGRHYPFVDDGPQPMVYSGGGSVELPYPTVVDMSVICGLDGEHQEELHRVYLYEVSRTGDVFTFRFRFTAPKLVAYELVFCRDRLDDEYAVDHVLATAIAGGTESGSSLTLECGLQVAEGWLTTGPLDNLDTILADGEWLRRADGSIWVEPAQVQSMYKAFARSLNLANAPRLTVVPDASCSSAGPTDDDYIVHARCLSGNIRWKEGFNSTIRQVAEDNAIVIGAGIGSGDGEPCSEVPLYEGETPPAGSTLLTGGPSCNELVKTLNGLSGANQQLIPGRGVSINPDTTDPHKVVVDIHLRGLAICPDFLADSESSLTLD